MMSEDKKDCDAPDHVCVCGAAKPPAKTAGPADLKTKEGELEAEKKKTGE